MKGKNKVWDIPDKKPDFSFSQNRVLSILSNDKRLYDMYRMGILNTEIMLHDRKHKSLTPCYLGHKDKQPKPLLDLLWYVAPTCLNYVFEIYSGEGHIQNIRVHSEGNCIVVNVGLIEGFDITTVVLQEGSELKIVHCDGHMFKESRVFLDILRNLLKWVDEYFIIDVYSVELWLMQSSDVYDKLGAGEYYMGFAHATGLNQIVDILDSGLGDRRGEYSVAFLEVL